MLTQLAANPAPALDSNYMLHLYAICLLAQFRETRAYRPIVEFATRSDAVAEDLFGDFVSANLGRAIASVCDGDLAPIKSLAENSEVGVWVRGAAIDALQLRFLKGEADAQDVPAYLDQLGNREASALRELSEDERDTTFLSLIVYALCDVGPTSALASVRSWYAESLVDESMVELEEVEVAAHKSFAELREGLVGRARGYVLNAVTESDHWACFDPERDEEDDLNYIDDDLQMPYVRPEPKIGRNEPCPCGSGKNTRNAVARSFSDMSHLIPFPYHW